MERRLTRCRASRLVALAALPACAAACDRPPPPIGEHHEVAVATPPEIWQALAPQIVAALEPRTFTVRNERIFDVAYIPPGHDAWRGELRRMRKILLIGSAHEPLIAEALTGRDWKRLRLPAVIQLTDVWAQQQLVTVALLPEAAGPGALEPLLPRIGEALLERLKEHARLRMAVTPPNERLAEHLRQVEGFTLAVPSRYDASEPEPGVYVFRHEDEGLTPIIQGIAVDSRPRGTVAWTAQAAGEWRARLAERLNEPGHVTEALPRWHEAEVAGQRTLHVQGVWSLPPGGWPGGGPFMSRLVECGDRVYLLDAWLYAPGDAKYELMVQLDIILDTFRCPAAGPRDV